MTKEDIPVVMDIDHQSYPWPATEQYFFECLKRYHFGTCRPWVARYSGLLIGYMIWHLVGSSAQGLQLQRLAVHQDWRGRGIGRNLYRLFMREFETNRYTYAELLAPELLLAPGQDRTGLEWVKRRQFANGFPKARTVGDNICFRRLPS